jgi:hypothetical protein
MEKGCLQQSEADEMEERTAEENIIDKGIGEAANAKNNGKLKKSKMA